MILSKILCGIQIWASKIQIQEGQNFKLLKKDKNIEKYCTQNSFTLFSTHTVQSYCINTLNIKFLYIVIQNKYQIIIKLVYCYNY